MNYWKLFRIVRKESEFQYNYCRNSTKSMREKKKKGGERKCWISVMWILKFLCPISAARVWSGCGVPKVKKKKKKKLWQTNCGNVIAEIGEKKIVTIVATALPKIGGKKKWFRNIGRSKKKNVTFTTYLLVVWSKFKLSICDLKFDTLPTWGLTEF